MPRHALVRNRYGYGLTTVGDLFTDRQLVALTTFSDLVGEARAKVLADARAAGRAPDPTPLAEGGSGAQAYADAVAVYLAFALIAWPTHRTLLDLRTPSWQAQYRTSPASDSQ